MVQGLEHQNDIDRRIFQGNIFGPGQGECHIGQIGKLQIIAMGNLIDLQRRDPASGSR